ncbi:ATP-grasp domain-containing protein [Candidatus Dependentiae bacterium]|nr:MAG: ATP-grasp domain-containing protein [Candidatus Dependentiae bacterium]
MVDYQTKKNSFFVTKKTYGRHAKMRVGVLMGGRSPENEVSFNSGRTVCDHLDTNLYDIVPIYQAIKGNLYILPWYFLHRGKTTDFEHRLEKDASSITWDALKNTIDFMYIATHGNYAEDGTLQGFLELLGIPYLGAGIFASALRMDKIAHKTVLQHAGILVPRFMPLYPADLADKNNLKNTIINRLATCGIGFACVIKPYNQGSSIGVSVAHTIDQLIAGVYQAATVTGKLQAVVIEEYILGMEFSCITLVDNEKKVYLPLPPTEIVKESHADLYDYEQKYMPGRGTKYTPARCGQEYITKIQETCVRVMQIMDFCTISRIDGFLTTEGDVYIFDPNSLSGMGPASFLFLQAAEINMGHRQLINHLIQSELIHYGIGINRENDHMNQQIKKQKVRVVVLMGGSSNEKETSLESGRNVVYKLSTEKYDVIPLFVSQEHELYRLEHSLLVRNSTKEIQALLKKEMQVLWHDLPRIADFVFIALHGGIGENGSVQGALEMLNMPYNGSSVFASSLCMDKYKANTLLGQHDIDVPLHMLVEKHTWEVDAKKVVAAILKKFIFPIIVKPSDDGCSVMIQKVEAEADIYIALETIFNSGKTTALVEEFIIGIELTVGVLGNEQPMVLPASQCISKAAILTMEEKFLPGAGENQTPALISPEAKLLVAQVIAKTYQVTQCKGYARIDCFYQTAQQSSTQKERVVILEINTLPALTPATCLFHQAAEVGIKPAELLDHIINYGLQLHVSISQNQYADVTECINI